tara:strand:- start:387 stop:1544 length:1158 start_codon:yes stop_codon:yes gene_type:complete
MSTNKNKFNTSKKTKEWFPFAKYLFITDNHPIRQSQDKCSSSIEAIFSQQELEQINGITNSLQCDTREAIRIALFEVIEEAHAAYEKTYEKAKSGSTCKGHEGRKTKKRLTLPLSEKQNALDVAAQLNISIKEFLRLAVIWLADGIKEETITSLTKSRRIGKDTIAYQWSRENRNKPASKSVKNLKEAQKDARELQEYIDSLEEEEFSTELPFVIQSELAREELARSAEQNHWETELLRQHEMMSDVEFLARCKMREFNIDFETAKEWVEDDLNEATMFSKMTSKEKKEFLQKENHRYKQLEKEAKARADKKFQEAVEQRAKENPISIDVDLLEQHSKDIEGSRIISAEEIQKDMEDYKNEPLLWDEESDRTFHRMMNQTKDADG